METPYYIVYEERLRRNLSLITGVAADAGVEIIMAFKANALWKTFGIFREYGVKSTASSLNELRLGNEELGRKVHSYCPAYTDSTIDEYLAGSSHITFNSLDQFSRFAPRAIAAGVSPGLRVNPECSVIETDIYNPALPGSRFGVTAAMLGDTLPDGIEGFHFHALCESSSHDLEKVLGAFEAQFGRFLPQLKWVNMGGGHLMTREGYDTRHLVDLLKDFRRRHPNLHVILEPGSAWTWRTGDLICSVVDVVENQGVATAIIDASFACHMPDCLEMPYKPAIVGAHEPAEGEKRWRMGGTSCLAGDYCGDWAFDHELKVGERIVFEDMIHYTMVKTTLFNGVAHPSIVIARRDGRTDVIREFGYEDFRNRMS